MYLSKYHTMIKIVDYANNYNDELWQKFQNYVVTTHDDMKYNYINLDPKSFVSFPVVIVDNTIICFSGLQVNKDWWGEGIGRVSSRMWIHPEYRHTGKFTSGAKFLNTTYCLPLQLAKAQLIGLDCVFVSREHNLKGFEEYLKLIKVNCNTEFIMEPTKYALNGSSYVEDPESMKQWVMLYYLTNNGQQRWLNQMKQYALIN
jgi:hypothetical protein